MKRFLPERGQGLVEYALILLLVAIVVIIGVTALGTKTSTMFSDIGDKITTMAYYFV